MSETTSHINLATSQATTANVLANSAISEVNSLKIEVNHNKNSSTVLENKLRGLCDKLNAVNLPGLATLVYETLEN